MITRALQLVPQRCPAPASQMCIIDTASRGSAGCGDPVGRPTVIAVKTPSRPGSRNGTARSPAAATSSPHGCPGPSTASTNTQATRPAPPPGHPPRSPGPRPQPLGPQLEFGSGYSRQLVMLKLLARVAVPRASRPYQNRAIDPALRLPTSPSQSVILSRRLQRAHRRRSAWLKTLWRSLLGTRRSGRSARLAGTVSMPAPQGRWWSPASAPFVTGGLRAWSGGGGFGAR